MRTQAMKGDLKALYESDAEDGPGLQDVRWRIFADLDAMSAEERRELARRVAADLPGGEEDFLDWLDGAL